MMFLAGLLIGWIIGIITIVAVACIVAAGDSEKIDNKKQQEENKMDRMANKIIFLTAISDAFKDEDDREINAVGKIDIPEDGNATPILTDLFYAFKAFYTLMSGDNVDSIEFIGVLMRLVFQDQLNDNSEAEDNSSGDFSDMLEDGEEDD